MLKSTIRRPINNHFCHLCFDEFVYVGLAALRGAVERVMSDRDRRNLDQWELFTYSRLHCVTEIVTWKLWEISYNDRNDITRDSGAWNTERGHIDVSDLQTVT